MTASRVQAAQVTLAWDAAPQVWTGYIVYYGSTSGEYEGSVDVGPQTTSTLIDLEEGKAYFFAVVSYDASGQESESAPEIAFGGPQEVPQGRRTTMRVPERMTPMIPKPRIRMTSRTMPLMSPNSRTRQNSMPIATWRLRVLSPARIRKSFRKQS